MIAEPRPGLKVTWRRERQTNIPKAHSGCSNSSLIFHKVARRLNGPKREVTERWRKSCNVVRKKTKVSEEHVAAIFRVDEQVQARNLQA
jgi:hypothetical protein